MIQLAHSYSVSLVYARWRLEVWRTSPMVHDTYLFSMSLLILPQSVLFLRHAVDERTAQGLRVVRRLSECGGPRQRLSPRCRTSRLAFPMDCVLLWIGRIETHSLTSLVRSGLYLLVGELSSCTNAIRQPNAPHL